MSQTTPAQTDPNVIVLRGRLSYPDLVTPKSFKVKPGEKPKAPSYGASLIFDKVTGAKEIKRLETLIAALAAAEWKNKIITVKGAPAGTKLVDQPGNPKAERVVLVGTCLHDGAEKADKDGYGDHVMYISSSRPESKGPPKVTDKNFMPVDPKDETFPYAGSQVIASFRLWTQDNPEYGKRVNAELRGVIFDKHGEPFGAAPVNVESDFAGVNLDEDVESAPAKDVDIDDM